MSTSAPIPVWDRVFSLPNDLPDLAVAAYGDPLGQPILFCHGWPNCRSQAAAYHQAAASAGALLLAPDRPGIGRSSPQPGRRLASWPPLLDSLADALDLDSFSIIGVSGGAPYALATAHALPRRTRAIAIVAGTSMLGGTNMRGMFWLYRLLQALRRSSPEPLHQLPVHVARLIAACPPWRPPLSWLVAQLPAADRRHLRDRSLFALTPDAFSTAVFSDPRQVVADGDIYFDDWPFLLSEITVPTLIFHGAADRNIPLTKAQDLASSIPSARLITWPEDGHYSAAMGHPVEVVTLLLEASRS